MYCYLNLNWQMTDFIARIGPRCEENTHSAFHCSFVSECDRKGFWIFDLLKVLGLCSGQFAIGTIIGYKNSTIS